MRFDVFTSRFAETHLAPDKLAVAGSDGDWTWRELAVATEALAGILRDLRLSSRAPVMIIGNKERRFVATILACLREEICFIPVDRDLPVPRLAAIAAQARPQLIIECGDEPSPLTGIARLRPDLALTGEPSREDVYEARPHDPLRYIIFTSGSTGAPKGVMVARNALWSFSRWLLADFGFHGADVLINQASFSFDLSLFDVLGAAHTGASLVLCEAEGGVDKRGFVERVRRYGGTFLMGTPSFTSLAMLNPAMSADSVPSLRAFVIGGEAFPPRLLRALRKRFPNAVVKNVYGPTEGTGAMSLIELTDELAARCPSLPVGGVRAGTEIRLERSSRQVVDGREQEVGEVVIVGDHMAQGYLGLPERTAAAFFDDPDGVRRGYRTGDLGYISDGMLFVRGRVDDVIKLRGHLIDLGDIDAHIRRVPGVRECATIPTRAGGEIVGLVAFIQPAEALAFDLPATILAEARASLPRYMVPREVRLLDRLPLTPSHKIDRKALAALT